MQPKFKGCCSTKCFYKKFAELGYCSVTVWQYSAATEVTMLWLVPRREDVVPRYVQYVSWTRS